MMNFLEHVIRDIHHPMNARRNEILVNRRAVHELAHSFARLDADMRARQPVERVGRFVNLKHAVELCYVNDADSMEAVLDVVMATINEKRKKDPERRIR